MYPNQMKENYLFKKRFKPLKTFYEARTVRMERGQQGLDFLVFFLVAEGKKLSGSFSEPKIPRKVTFFDFVNFPLSRGKKPKSKIVRIFVR